MILLFSNQSWWFQVWILNLDVRVCFEGPSPSRHNRDLSLLDYGQ